MSWLINPFKKNLFRVKDTSIAYFKQIMCSKAKMRLFILFYLILVVSLKISLSEYRPGYADPGGDSAFVIDGAMNIRDGNGYTYDSIWIFDESDGTISTTISKPAFLYPPMTSILLSFVFIFTESIFAAIVAQVLIFFLCIIIYFELISNLFNNRIALFSSIFISTNPIIIFELVAVPRSHILGFFFVVLFFYVVYQDINKKYKYYLIGIVAALAYLTRDINLLLLASFCSYFLLNKKFTVVSKVLTSFIIITIPWFYRNYKYYGTINPRPTTVGYYYPPAGLPDSQTSFISVVTDSSEILSVVANMHQLLFDFSSPNFYFILFPFLLFGIIRNMNQKYHLLHIYLLVYFSFLILITLYDKNTGFKKHYFLPFFILSTPFAISSFIKITTS